MKFQTFRGQMLVILLLFKNYNFEKGILYYILDGVKRKQQIKSIKNFN